MNREILPSVSGLGTEIVFGDIDSNLIKSHVAEEKYIVVTSPAHMKNGNTELLIKAIQRDPELIIHDTPTNPTEEYFQKSIDNLPNVSAQLVVALGGGSCIDSGKVFARILSNREINSLESLLNEERKLSLNRSLPLVAIPTTAGTGSEVTPFATIWSFNNGTKRSLLGKDVAPRSAMVFPTLCTSAPKSVMISSAFDALSHGLDSMWNKNSTQESLDYSIRSVDILSNLLWETNFDHPSKSQIEQLSLGSLFAGLAISITRTSLSHSISYPLTYRYGLAHGIACSFSLPAIIEFAKNAGFTFPENRLQITSDPEMYFRELFHKHGVKETIRKSITNSKEILEDVPRMNHAGRVENCVFPLGSNEITQIVGRSIEMIYS